MRLTELALLDAVKSFHAARRAVNEWMQIEGEAGRLRQNSQAPAWPEYERAESRIWETIALLDEAGPVEPVTYTGSQVAMPPAPEQLAHGETRRDTLTRWAAVVEMTERDMRNPSVSWKSSTDAIAAFLRAEAAK